MSNIGSLTSAVGFLHSSRTASLASPQAKEPLTMENPDIAGINPAGKASDEILESYITPKESAKAELTLKERRDLELMEQMDRNIRQHEHTHIRAAQGLAVGAPTFEYERGPDGQHYAVHGRVEVSSDIPTDDTEAALAKARKIERAALAPSDPSSQDLKAATKARAIQTKAYRKQARDKVADIEIQQIERQERLNPSPELKAYKDSITFQQNLSNILDLFT